MTPTEPNNTLPAPTPPVVGGDVVEYIRTNRETTAYILLGLSVLFLVLTIWTAVRGFKTPATKGGDKPAATNPLDPLEQEKKTVEISNPRRMDWLIGAVLAMGGFLVVAATGAWVLVSPPPTVEPRQRSEARQLILVVGGLIGVLISLAGLAYFYQWSDALSAWLDKGEFKESRYVLIPLAVTVAGAGLSLLSAMPARAEERNNALLRRLVYGTNFYVTVLLVLVILVAGNVAFARKAPNTLDATETGFYTLSDTTKSFLQRLDQPITAYMVLPDSSGREITDIRQVLMAYHDASNGRFSVRFVSPVSDKNEVRRLAEQYARMDKDGMGILLVSGTEDRPQFQKHGWVPAQELFTTEMSRDGKSQVQAFAGEGRLLKEVRILAETDTRPVIYFTQSNGELSIGKSGPQDAVDPSQSAARLQAYLEASYSTDVKPLLFPTGEASPQVPNDATIVVVAQPQTPLSDAAVGALRRYMGERKGKLIVLSGAVTSLEGRGMTMTGLEGLLAEYNVELGKKFIYTAPVDPRINPVLAYATINRAARNPITESLSQNIRTLPFPFAREVKPMTGSPAMQATTLLQTAPRLETWLEDERLDRVFPAYRALESSEALRVQKQMTTNPRSLMVAVQESGGAGRVVVMGNAMLVSDEVAQSSGGRGSTDVPITFDLVGVSVDWLRDRPPLPAGVVNKQYVTYEVPDPVALNNTRLLYLPLGLGMVVVLGLGAGVWAVRRR